MAKDYQEPIYRLDEYVHLISATLTLAELLRNKACYKKLPDDFQISHKRSWETIINDIKSLDYEAKELASMLADERENEKARA